MVKRRFRCCCFYTEAANVTDRRVLSQNGVRRDWLRLGMTCPFWLSRHNAQETNAGLQKFNWLGWRNWWTPSQRIILSTKASFAWRAWVWVASANLRRWRSWICRKAQGRSDLGLAWRSGWSRSFREVSRDGWRNQGSWWNVNHVYVARRHRAQLLVVGVWDAAALSVDAAAVDEGGVA